MLPIRSIGRKALTAILALTGTLAPVSSSWAQNPLDKLLPITSPWEAPPGQQPSFNLAIHAALKQAGGPQQNMLDAYYASRGNDPVWISKGDWTPAAKIAFQRLQRASEDGLNLTGYRLMPLDLGPEDSMALADVALSQAVAAYAFQASGGRINPASVSDMIGARPTIIAPAQALNEVSQAVDADYALEGFNPTYPGYRSLRQTLAQLRASSGSGPKINGVTEAEIIANMELWRWLPHDLGAERIVVNVPEFMARLYVADAEVLSTRVIVGKPDHPTPLFSNKMQYLIVNPSWNVPASIIENEMSDDPEELQAKGFHAEYVDGELRVRQPPGARNALGRIKFMFPNGYSVYLHDTPSRGLFASSHRALSHGCVRVENPFKLAEALLQPENGLTEARLKKMIGSKEQRIDLRDPVPIHLAYFTITVDENGELHHFEDIYGYTNQVQESLGLSD